MSIATNLRKRSGRAIVLPMDPVILSAPDIVGGTPCFAGARLPFQILLDYLEAGQPLNEFVLDFPGVSRDAAIGALRQAGELALAHARVT